MLAAEVRLTRHKHSELRARVQRCLAGMLCNPARLLLGTQPSCLAPPECGVPAARVSLQLINRPRVRICEVASCRTGAGATHIRDNRVQQTSAGREAVPPASLVRAARHSRSFGATWPTLLQLRWGDSQAPATLTRMSMQPWAASSSEAKRSTCGGSGIREVSRLGPGQTNVASSKAGGTSRTDPAGRLSWKQLCLPATAAHHAAPLSLQKLASRHSMPKPSSKRASSPSARLQGCTTTPAAPALWHRSAVAFNASSLRAVRHTKAPSSASAAATASPAGRRKPVGRGRTVGAVRLALAAGRRRRRSCCGGRRVSSPWTSADRLCSRTATACKLALWVGTHPLPWTPQ